jgi:hypothetical protein
MQHTYLSRLAYAFLPLLYAREPTREQSSQEGTVCAEALLQSLELVVLRTYVEVAPV